MTPLLSDVEKAALLERLTHARESWHQAFDDGELALADMALKTLDSLLDLWPAGEDAPAP